MIYSQKVKKNFIIAVALNLFLAFILSYAFFVVLRPKQLVFNQSQLDLQDVNVIQLNYSTFKKSIDDTKPEQDKLKSVIVNKKSLPALIEKIEGLAASSGVELTKNITVEKSVTTKENYLKFEMKVKGKFSDVFYFLGMQENLPYKIRIKRLGIGAGESEVISDAFATPIASSVNGGKINGITKGETVWAGDISFDLLSYINE